MKGFEHTPLRYDRRPKARKGTRPMASTTLIALQEVRVIDGRTRCVLTSNMFSAPLRHHGSDFAGGIAKPRLLLARASAVRALRSHSATNHGEAGVRFSLSHDIGSDLHRDGSIPPKLGRCAGKKCSRGSLSRMARARGCGSHTRGAHGPPPYVGLGGRSVRRRTFTGSGAQRACVDAMAAPAASA